ncbi:PrpF domain-containing protein [Actinophytocola sp.]|uniref:PrpF domain-containing protein n=1 Tax=Actinophytocola sp. TaxID=1872138 RepID=UPI002D7F982E|nr:PrpF domain-containing protein [Actinophytocola sp.]HET9138296.1 PrpF domain-containing protein [Actinophytocola sp.]
MTGVRCALMRGGTSKGALLLAADLPPAGADRDELLLRIMGSPDPRQIDGLGGAHPLTSKVGVVAQAAGPDADVDYLFLQVAVDEPVVSPAQTCGNILAAVGPFAIERGLVPALDGSTEVRVRMVNTGGLATLRVRTPGGVVGYDGDTELSGVPGTAAPVEIVLEPSGAPLLPTGRVLDRLDGLDATCIDNGMPSVLVRAADLGRTGRESPAELEADSRLTARVARIRAAAAPLMGLATDLEASTVPKIVLVAPPGSGGVLGTRSFIPLRVHQAIGVLGAASVAAAAALPGSVAHDVAVPAPGGEPVRVEHPTGFLDVGIAPAAGGGVVRTTVVRTARMIFDGTVYPGPTRLKEASHSRAIR